MKIYLTEGHIKAGFIDLDDFEDDVIDHIKEDKIQFRDLFDFDPFEDDKDEDKTIRDEFYDEVFQKLKDKYSVKELEKLL